MPIEGHRGRGADDVSLVTVMLNHFAVGWQGDIMILSSQEATVPV